MNKENNGKNFLFRCGPAIFGMIEKAIYPTNKDENEEQYEKDSPYYVQPLDVFDPWEGANFRLARTTKGKELPKYDSSVELVSMDFLPLFISISYTL